MVESLTILYDSILELGAGLRCLVLGLLSVCLDGWDVRNPEGTVWFYTHSLLSLNSEPPDCLPCLVRHGLALGDLMISVQRIPRLGRYARGSANQTAETPRKLKRGLWSPIHQAQLTVCRDSNGASLFSTKLHLAC